MLLKTRALMLYLYDGPQTLFYCDPPYYEAESLYDTGSFVFDESQHVVLRDILVNIKR